MPRLNFADLPNNTASSWWNDRGLRMSMLHIVILYLAVFSLGYDGSLLNGLQALPSWQENFGHPKGVVFGLIAATYYLPKIPTTFVVAWLVDKLGRKKPLYIGSAFMLAGGVFGGLSNSRAELIGARILLGIGTAFAQITACALVPELAHPRIRHMAGGFLNTTWFVGSILASWTTFGCVYWPDPTSNWAWRVPTLIQGLGPSLLCIGVAFVPIPGSPRWLVKNGRHTEAHRILATYHANGHMDDLLVLFEMREIEINVKMEEKANSAGWAAFFKTIGNRRRFFIIIMLGSSTQWLGNSLVSYFLVPILKQVNITKPAQTAGINGGLAVWSWIAGMTGAYLCDRFGRRALFLVSLAGCWVSFGLITGLSGAYAINKQSAEGIAMIPFLFLFNSAYSLAFNPLPMLYTPEISPFALRAKSAALLLLSQNLAQTFNQFASPVALQKLEWKYYIVYVGVIALYIVLFSLFIRETRGLTVEEAAVVYEPEELRQLAATQERQLAAVMGPAGQSADQVHEVKMMKSRDDEWSAVGSEPSVRHVKMY